MKRKNNRKILFSVVVAILFLFSATGTFLEVVDTNSVESTNDFLTEEKQCEFSTPKLKKR